VWFHFDTVVFWKYINSFCSVPGAIDVNWLHRIHINIYCHFRSISSYTISTVLQCNLIFYTSSSGKTLIRSSWFEHIFACFSIEIIVFGVPTWLIRNSQKIIIFDRWQFRADLYHIIVYWRLYTFCWSETFWSNTNIDYDFERKYNSLWYVRFLLFANDKQRILLAALLKLLKSNRLNMAKKKKIFLFYCYGRPSLSIIKMQFNRLLKE